MTDSQLKPAFDGRALVSEGALDDPAIKAMFDREAAGNFEFKSTWGMGSTNIS
mgnify:CR=1 FL=1